MKCVKCDVCGRVFKEGSESSVWLMRFDESKNTLYDLCDECFSKISRFVNGGELEIENGNGTEKNVICAIK